MENLTIIEGVTLDHNKQVYRYRNLTGSIEISTEEGVVFGKILDIPDLVTYEGETLYDLRRAFKKAVDDYISENEF